MSQESNFKNYKIIFKPSAYKELDKLESSVAKAIDKKLVALVSGAPNSDVIKMQGVGETYRLRCGEYRIIFEVHKHIITILVIDVAHRKEVYRKY